MFSLLPEAEKKQQYIGKWEIHYEPRTSKENLTS